MRRSLQSTTVLLSGLVIPVASGFDLPLILPALPHHAAPSIFEHASSVWTASTTTATAAAAESPAFVNNMNPISVYLNTLATYPLPTKMLTGATLAVAGDAIAQAREPAPYDQRRAVSFAAFDMAYRALQHAAFPAIVGHFHGQYMASAASLIFSQYYLPLDFAAALERVFTSQLGIVPFLYYPVFFALTAWVQGLGVQGGVERAKTMFVPLMSRNLLFWLPIQYVQFSFVPEDLQIPFLSVAGLFWTFILSVLAGSTKEFEEKDEVYCVTGSEESCVLPEDHLFPDVTLEEITEELNHEAQVVADAISHEFEEITHVIFDNDNQDTSDGKLEKVDAVTEEKKEEVFK